MAAINTIELPGVNEISFVGWDERLRDEEKFDMMAYRPSRGEAFVAADGTMYFDTEMDSCLLTIRPVLLTDQELSRIRAKKVAELKRSRVKSSVVSDPFPYLRSVYEVELLMPAPSSHLDPPIGKRELWRFPLPQPEEKERPRYLIYTPPDPPRPPVYTAKFVMLEAAYAYVLQTQASFCRLAEARRKEAAYSKQRALELKAERLRRQKRRRDWADAQLDDRYEGETDSDDDPVIYTGSYRPVYSGQSFSLPPIPPSSPPPPLRLDDQKQPLCLRDVMIQQSKISKYFQAPPPSSSSASVIPSGPLDLFGRLKKKSRRLADSPPVLEDDPAAPTSPSYCPTSP